MKLDRFYAITVPHQRGADLEEYRSEQHFIDATADEASQDSDSNWWEYVATLETAREYAVHDLSTIIIIATSSDFSSALQYRGHQLARVRALLDKIESRESMLSSNAGKSGKE
jgi:hypothetical protein